MKAVEDAVAEGKKTLESAGHDLSAMKHATEKINAASHKIAEEMYKKASAADASGAAGQGAAEGAKQDTVVEAEVVDENKSQG